MNLAIRIFVAVVALLCSIGTFAFKLQRPAATATLTRSAVLPYRSNLFASRKTYWPVKKVKEYQSPYSRFCAALKSFAPRINVGGFASKITSIPKALVNIVITILKKVIKTMLSLVSMLKSIAMEGNNKPPSPFPPMSKLAPAPASPVIPASQIASSAKMLTPSSQPVSPPPSSSSLSSPSSASTSTTSTTLGKKASYWPPKSAARLINDADKQYAQRVLSELSSPRVTPPPPTPPSISTASSSKSSKYWPPKRPTMYSAASTATASIVSPVVSTPVEEVVEDKAEVPLAVDVGRKMSMSTGGKYFPPKPVKSYVMP